MTDSQRVTDDTVRLLERLIVLAYRAQAEGDDRTRAWLHRRIVGVMRDSQKRGEG